MDPTVNDSVCARTASASCRSRGACALVAAAFSAGCEWRQGALAPAAAESSQINGLFWIFFWISWVIFALVAVSTTVACLRARDGTDPHEMSRDPALERRMRRAVAASTVTSVMILVGLLVASVASGRVLSDLGRSAPMTIEVTAHQWWWEVRYPGAAPDESFSTANELHVPVDRNVRVVLGSNDVIHSFWVPRLTGKRDLIPGRTTVVAFRVDAGGTYPGRCAEFCGVEHAKMDLSVVADDKATFERWRSAQRMSGVISPEGDLARYGHAVFLRSSCAVCHRVAGTLALATVGPDLTHIASRRTLAAGALPNDPRSMMGWIKDPQRFKPGARMPATPLSDGDVTALVAYLGSLR